MRVFIYLLLLLLCLHGVAQEKVTFSSTDKLTVTADLYLKNKNLPFIILCHQANSSRGEYLEIAAKLLKLNYNCLAVDLRSGDNINFIKNETAERAKNEDIPHTFLDSEKDIEASIQYVKKFNRQSVILFGSSYSASLCLLIGKNNQSNVRAIIAFSPGEYFRPSLIVKDAIAGLNIPIFVSVTSLEYEYVTEMLSGVHDKLKTIVKPSRGSGIHGAKALWEKSETSDECWLELLMFFKKI